jgi:trans-aconitate methyltransferase
MRVSQLVGMAVSAAKHSSSSRILEIGCGPGTATVAFAQLGFPMVCLEPYPSVHVINQSMEDWDLEPQAFDAVLAASSMHWIPAEVYQRHAPALGRTENKATQERILSGLLDLYT